MSFSLESYLSDLERIVNIDSGSENIEGISEVADFFTERYNDIGFKVKRYFEKEKTGCSLIVTNNQDVEYDVLLIGHLDTVFKKGTAAKRPFKIENNCVYGPGVIDMKSGLLLIYYLLKEISESDYMDDLNICAILNGDEEIGSKNSRKIIKEEAKKAKMALVLEPARENGECVLERKGISGYNLEFEGKAAHAGVEPQKGISSVVELARWIMELDKLNDYQVGTTVNIGVIEGGTASNVIPEHATASLDLRFKSDQEKEKVEKRLAELKNNPGVKGVKAKVIHRGVRPPMQVTDKSLKLWEKIKSIGQKYDLKMDWISTGGGSDANFTSAMGVPTVDGLGPAGGRPHSVDEYLKIDSIEPKFNLLLELIKYSKEF